MCAAPMLTHSTWDELLYQWQELDVPEGWRAEIVEERIVMTPPPDNAHNLIASRVNKSLVRGVPDDWEIFQTIGVAAPLRKSLFIPDLVVIPQDRLPAVDAPEPVSAENAVLAVEITSKGNADTDRKTKLWAYAHAEVPLYLLIDRFAETGPTVELFSSPDGGAYQESHRVPFGKEIALPEPVEMTLDTGEF